MEFLELIQKRRSVRKYQERLVEQNTIHRCLEAARLAPSACNAQPWKFIVVDDPVIRRKVAQQTFSQVVPFNRFVLNAPLLIVIVMERPNLSSQIGGILKRKEYSLIDIGIAAEHFSLQAAQEGLGTCILGWFNEKPIKKLLEIPRSKRIGLLIAVGYPELELAGPKARKPMDEMVSYNRY